MKKLISLIAASMFVSAVAFAQVPQQNQQQGTMPQQNQTTSPEQNQQNPQQNAVPQQNTMPQQSTVPQQNQSTYPEPTPQHNQNTLPQQEEQQGSFPWQGKDTTSPKTDTSGQAGDIDTSGVHKFPRL